MSSFNDATNVDAVTKQLDGLSVQQPPVDHQGSPPKTVDVSNLSDVDVIKLIQMQEYQQKKERWDKYNAKKLEKAKNAEKDHKFWNTQPVPKLQDTFAETEVEGPINGNTNLADVKADPYNMPAGFVWCDLNVFDPTEVKEMYTLLNENYVEDDEQMFRFDYSIDFLQWALTPPGYLKQWHVGVRNAKTGSLMGCITAIPAEVRVHDHTRSMVEINFLCVHKKLRTKRLAPVLIKEITRRVNLTNRWQAVYTAGVVLPKPVGKCRYYHRSLNPKKLIEVKFSHLPQKMTIASMITKYKLPDKPRYKFRTMVAEDAPQVHALLSGYLAKKKLAQVFSQEEVQHVFVTRKGVVESFVLENGSGKITDFCSFYHLPSSVIGNDKHKTLHAVYSYYNIATTVPFVDLISDLLILAKASNVDVFNALDLSENLEVFEPLKFGQGDGNLQYYVYNWKCPDMPPGDIGLVLL